MRVDGAFGLQRRTGWLAKPCKIVTTICCGNALKGHDSEIQGEQLINHSPRLANAATVRAINSTL